MLEGGELGSVGKGDAGFQRFKNRLDGLFGLDAAHSSSIELGQYGVHDVQFNQTFLPFAGLKQSPLRLALRASSTARTRAALWADARGCARGCQDVTPRLN